MEPFSFFLIAGLLLVYFLFYRPAFVVKPEKDRASLIEKFEEAAGLNRQLITELSQYADRYNCWDQPFAPGETFQQKYKELETARNELLSDQNLHGLRSLNAKKLNFELMKASLEDQIIWHNRVRITLHQHMTNPVER